MEASQSSESAVWNAAEFRTALLRLWGGFGTLQNDIRVFGASKIARDEYAPWNSADLRRARGPDGSHGAPKTPQRHRKHSANLEIRPQNADIRRYLTAAGLSRPFLALMPGACIPQLGESSCSVPTCAAFFAGWKESPSWNAN